MSDLENGVVPAAVRVNDKIFPAGPAHFGKEISGDVRYVGRIVPVEPFDACTAIINKENVADKFALAQRGQCTFAQKVRNMQVAGVKLAIVMDNVPDSTHESAAIFAMSGDGKDDITIPAAFLFSQEGAYLAEQLQNDPNTVVVVGELKSMRREFENVCDEGTCDATVDGNTVSAPSNDKESFDHLKKVLSKLVAQFELSLSNDEPVQKTCGEGTAPDIYLAQNKFLNEKRTELQEATSPVPPVSPNESASSSNRGDTDTSIHVDENNNGV